VPFVAVISFFSEADLLGGEDAFLKKKEDYEKELDFAAIVGISAYKSQGLEELKDILFDLLQLKPMI